ncbi:MAG: zinc metallopeptidase [Candidatus Azobacteroides sp.]|nr:zinc metallopeptidase [Candidatus Azobacteroides sp.]
MKLEGRRTSSNVDDRRGSGGKAATLGIGGVILAVVVAWVMGGNPLDVLTSQLSNITQTGTEYVPSAEEEAMATFASQILAGTEDVWKKEFEKMGRQYTPPKMVLFTSATSSGCGSASSQTGPFYCPTDQTLYIDLSFFDQMKNQLGAGGDFAYAYVIAHEVGHHVQNLLGTLGKVQQMQSRASKKESNQLSVRVELQADFYAGIWAFYDNKMFKSLEQGDIEKGLNAATAIGDDRLQMEAQGYTVPDSFNHGTSAQRVRWLKKGATTGQIADGDTFSPSYADL